LDIHVYWNILTMHGPINVKSPNNTSKWQMGFNSAFKGLTVKLVKIVRPLQANDAECIWLPFKTEDIYTITTLR
jgi:hypothetical protein